MRVDVEFKLGEWTSVTADIAEFESKLAYIRALKTDTSQTSPRTGKRTDSSQIGSIMDRVVLYGIALGVLLIALKVFTVIS